VTSGPCLSHDVCRCSCHQCRLGHGRLTLLSNAPLLLNSVPCAYSSLVIAAQSEAALLSVSFFQNLHSSQLCHAGKKTLQAPHAVSRPSHRLFTSFRFSTLAFKQSAMVTLPGRASNEQTAQLRNARAWLLDNIRNDWSYPNAPHVLPSYYDESQAAPGASAAPEASARPDTRVHVNQHIRQNITASAVGLAENPPIDSRERYYSDGEDSASDNENDNATTTFDTPDSVGTVLEDRKARRRRRRQKRFEDEMKENIGLAHWSAQRNTWTGAQPRAPAIQEAPPIQSASLRSESPGAPSVASTTTPPVVIAALPDTDLLVPVAPPLLPDNTVRSRITTNTYSDIYTKIVLQSRTPSIPINLTDVTRSLVHGWKEEGQWPPKPTPAEPSLVKKHGHPNIKGGLNKIGRALGLRGQGVPIEKSSAQGQV